MKFLDNLKRYYYITPTSYLEMIMTFKALLAEKRTEVQNMKDRYSNGYDCLIKTESSVSKMQLDLEELKP
jgi:dynein heavy chain